MQSVSPPREDEDEDLDLLDLKLSNVEQQLGGANGGGDPRNIQELEERLAAVENRLEELSVVVPPINLHNTEAAPQPPAAPVCESEDSHQPEQREATSAMEALISPRTEGYSHRLELALNEITSKLWARFKSSRHAFLFLDRQRNGAIEKTELQFMLRAHNMSEEAATEILDLFEGPEIKANEFIKTFGFK